MAFWRCSTVCKTSTPGSNPGGASNFLQQKPPTFDATAQGHRLHAFSCCDPVRGERDCAEGVLRSSRRMDRLEVPDSEALKMVICDGPIVDPASFVTAMGSTLTYDARLSNEPLQRLSANRSEPRFRRWFSRSSERHAPFRSQFPPFIDSVRPGRLEARAQCCRRTLLEDLAS